MLEDKDNNIWFGTRGMAYIDTIEKYWLNFLNRKNRR